MIRKKRQYVRPRQIFESERIKEENELVKKYGLKNKKEIWKALAKVNYYRRRAMELAKLPLEEQEVLLGKLQHLGLKVKSTADVLDLEIEDILDRRLPTIVAKKKMANTVQQARQIVVHQKILIDGKVVDSPSYLVSVDEEDRIEVKRKVKKAKVEKKVEEVPKEEKVEEVKEEKVEEKKEEVGEEKGEEVSKEEKPVEDEVKAEEKKEEGK